MTEVFLRILAALFVLFVATYFNVVPTAMPESLPDYCRIVVVQLILWGGLSIVLGPMMTGSGFLMRGHYISSGTPGCVWIAFGVVCWLIAFSILTFA